MVDRLLLGRSAQLATLRDALATRRATVVVGEQGVGKTTLMRAAAGPRALVGGGLQGLRLVPFLALDRAAPGIGEAGDLDEVAATLLRRAGGRPLLIDDVQWADAASRGVLARVVGRMPLLAAAVTDDSAARGVVRELVAAGFVQLSLAPLDTDDSRELVARLAPTLVADRLQPLLDATRGNPLLIEEALAAGGPSPSVRLAMTARLGRTTVAGRRAFLRLAAAAGPVDGELLGTARAPLEAAGLVVRTPDGRWEPRHALLADAALATLDPGAMVQLHRWLARRATSAADRSRHFAAAGDRERAYRAALEAADGARSEVERVAYRAMAVRVAPVAMVVPMTITVARELNDLRAHDEALALLDSVAPDQRPAGGAWETLHAEARWGQGDRHGAAEEAVAALERLAGDGTVEECDLRILLGSWLGSTAHDRTQIVAGVALARRHPSRLARARYIAAVTRGLQGDASAVHAVRAARSLARRIGDRSTEARAARDIGWLLLGAGDTHRALRHAVRCRQAADRTGVRAWANEFAVLEAEASRFLGRMAAFFGTCEVMLERPLLQIDRVDWLARYGKGLAETGRTSQAEEVRREIAGAPAWTWRHDAESAALGAAIAWADGRADDARRLGDESAGAEVMPVAAYEADLLRIWASADLGQVPPSPAVMPGLAMFAPLPMVLQGLTALAEGRADLAAESLAAAADGYAGRWLIEELRCRWAAGEALRQAGREDEARAVLADALARARAADLLPVAARIERVLHRLGVRVSMARGRDARGLTEREREVIALVGQGNTNAQIGRRLGISGDAVAQALRSVSTKMGTHGRIPTALAAMHRDPADPDRAT